MEDCLIMSREDSHELKALRERNAYLESVVKETAERLALYEPEQRKGTAGHVRAAEEGLAARDVEARRLESVVNLSPMLVVIWRCEDGWPVDLVSENIIRLLGYHASEFMSGKRSWLDIVVPEDRAELVKADKRNKESDSTVFCWEYRVMSADGDVRWMAEHTCRIYDSSGVVCQRKGIVYDVTERKRAEELLRTSEKRLARIIDSIPGVGVYGRDESGLFIWANRELRDIVGYEDELLGDVYTVLDLLFPDSGYRREMRRKLNSLEEGQDVEATVRCRNGREKMVSINRAPGDVCIPGFSEWGVVIDITERVRARDNLSYLNRNLERLVTERTRELLDKTEELEEANRRLKELDELKSSFVASVSHDIRTPLTSVLGFAKLVSRDFNRHFRPRGIGNHKLTRLGRRIDENLGVIGLEGERLTRLVNDFLDLARIESGRVNVEEQLCDVADLVSQAAGAVYGEYAQRPEISLRIDIEPDLPKVSADKDRLIQVLVNLLNNASKFTETGVVSIFAGMARGNVRFSVSDTGTGISETELPYVFDKFHQINRGDRLSAGPRGSGLGLSICKNIVSQYGGVIWAESTFGTGSTFSFELPAIHGVKSAGTNRSILEKRT